MLNHPVARRSASPRRAPERYDSTMGHMAPLTALKAGAAIQMAMDRPSKTQGAAAHAARMSMIAARTARVLIQGTARASRRSAGPTSMAPGT